jgi:formylglycine-generating enzyme required for sulfatase activity
VVPYNSLLDGRLQFYADQPVLVQGSTGVAGNFVVKACLASPGTCGPPAAPADAPPWGQCNWGVKGFEDHPVNCVTWDQAATFCAWTGMRLPTEFEWEAAARGLDAPGYGLREYPWGDPPATCALARMAQGGGAAGYGCGSGGMTAAVCSLPAGDTPEGLCDMAGNVAEWTLLPYFDYPPPGAGADEATRVVRGGGLADGASALRGAARNVRDPQAGYVDVGFRCVND